MHFCQKGPVFSRFSQMKVLFLPIAKISMLISLKSELQMKERDHFECFERKQ